MPNDSKTSGTVIRATFALRPEPASAPPSRILPASETSPDRFVASQSTWMNHVSHRERERISLPSSQGDTIDEHGPQPLQRFLHLTQAYCKCQPNIDAFSHEDRDLANMASGVSSKRRCERRFGSMTVACGPPELQNPDGVCLLFPRCPGCAARPWAMLCDGFAVAFRPNQRSFFTSTSTLVSSAVWKTGWWVSLM